MENEFTYDDLSEEGKIIYNFAVRHKHEFDYKLEWFWSNNYTCEKSSLSADFTTENSQDVYIYINYKEKFISVCGHYMMVGKRYYNSEFPAEYSLISNILINEHNIVENEKERQKERQKEEKNDKFIRSLNDI